MKTNICNCKKEYVPNSEINHKQLLLGDDELRVGFIYEINHKRLPLKAPTQLKSSRIALVTEKNELNVTVRFPSMLSLRVFFSGWRSQPHLLNLTKNRYPNPDLEYVIEANRAKKILHRYVSMAEFEQQRRRHCFWLVTSKISELSSMLMADGNTYGGSLHWGLRKKISFISSSLLKEEDIQNEVITVEETKMVTKKRKREDMEKNKKFQVSRREEKKQPSNNCAWSKDSYRKAKKKVFQIMKKNGAVVGRPMLRSTLRLEAKKHIRDTGLLDFLLQLMKFAPNGKDRIQSRLNADGAMEYWLENAELVNAKKEAGVAPPAGDSPAQDSKTCVVDELKLPESLMKREQDLLQISQSLKGIQNAKMSSDGKRAELEPASNNTATEISAIEKDNNTGHETKAEERAERSERVRIWFRFCKLFGTFLWRKSTNVLSPHQVLVPTPTSVTSGNTSASPLFLLPPPLSASPVQPLPLAKRPPVVKIPMSPSSTSYDPGDKVSTTNASLHLHHNQLGFRVTDTPRPTMVFPSTPVAHSECYEPRSDVMWYSSRSTRARTCQGKQQQQDANCFGRT